MQGIRAAGVRGWMFPFEKGDCRDYPTWLRADRGIKEERTEIDSPSRSAIRKLLLDAAKDPAPAARFEKRGHVLYPLAASGTEAQ